MTEDPKTACDHAQQRAGQTEGWVCAACGESVPVHSVTTASVIAEAHRLHLPVKIPHDITIEDMLALFEVAGWVYWPEVGDGYRACLLRPGNKPGDPPPRDFRNWLPGIYSMVEHFAAWARVPGADRTPGHHENIRDLFHQFVALQEGKR